VERMELVVRARGGASGAASGGTAPAGGVGTSGVSGSAGDTNTGGASGTYTGGTSTGGGGTSAGAGGMVVTGAIHRSPGGGESAQRSLGVRPVDDAGGVFFGRSVR
jgi:hypothetical protein